MSSKKYGPTLHIEPKLSRYLALALLFLHGMALVVAANLTIPTWASLAISIAVLMNFYQTFSVQVLGRGKQAVLSMVWDDDGRWTLIDGQHESIEAELMPNSYIHNHLLVLNFAIHNAGRRTAILLRDSLEPGKFRQLLTRIRLEANQ